MRDERYEYQKNNTHTSIEISAIVPKNSKCNHISHFSSLISHFSSLISHFSSSYRFRLIATTVAAFRQGNELALDELLAQG